MTRIEGNIAGSGYYALEIEAGRIANLQCLSPQSSPQPENLQCLSPQNLQCLSPQSEGASFLSPGFIDSQINGFLGADFSDPGLSPESFASMLEALWATGTTQFLPTVITNPPNVIEAAFRNLEQIRQESPRFAASVPGYHLEGPFMSPGPSAGAHRPEFMRDPDWEIFSRLNEAAGGRIRIVTIAPELPGAAEFTRKAVTAGIRVALSHTDGTPADVHNLAAAGASLNTHLGNGCPQLLDRHRAPFWAQLAEDRLAAGLICDGHHLTEDMVRIILRVKGLDRCLLVTDAVHVAGLEPGPYVLSHKPIELLPTGQVVTADRRSMAGSTLNMADAVARFRAMTGVSLAEALVPATRVPARYLAIPSLCSTIEAGQPANLVRFRDEGQRLVVEQTYLAGECVFPG